MKKLFLLASLLMAFGISADAGDITSPNGQIKVNFTLDGTVPTYSVTYQGNSNLNLTRISHLILNLGCDFIRKLDALFIVHLIRTNDE